MTKEDVDICCLVAVGDGKDLANTTVRAAQKKSFKQICEELNSNVEKLRSLKSKNQNKRNLFINLLPTL